MRQKYAVEVVELQQYFFYPAVIGVVHKLVLPVFTQNMLGHFDHDVVGGHLVVVGVAAQTLQAGRARGEHFHRFALR